MLRWLTYLLELELLVFRAEARGAWSGIDMERRAGSHEGLDSSLRLQHWVVVCVVARVRPLCREALVGERDASVVLSCLCDGARSS